MENDSNDSKKSSPNAVRTVRCPQCGRPAVYSPENPFRPFCSERCRLIDLGQWADESYRVPAESVQDPQDMDANDEGQDNSQ
jgi:hypothetical protein